MNYTIFMTNDCNMRCLYCYEKNKKKSSILIEVIDFVVEFIKKTMSKDNKFIIHGGEPLLEYEKIKYIVNKIGKISNENRFEFYITTNLTLLDEEKSKFLKENFQHISLSIDGNKYSHDKNRKLQNGLGTYNIIIKKLDRYFEKKLDSIIARMTVNENNVEDLSQNILHLIDLGFKNISPVVDQFGRWNQKNISVLRNEFLKVINNKTYNFEGIHIGFIKDAIFKCKNSECNGGISTFTIDTDGKIYPCVVVNGLSDFCIGNIYEGVNMKKRNSVLSHSDENNTQCLGCGRYDYCEATRCKIINKIQTSEWNLPSVNVCEIENLKVELAQLFL